ncbi:MAG: hypothetical protein ABSA76_07445 [Bacteroidales bacterium]
MIKIFRSVCGFFIVIILFSSITISCSIHIIRQLINPSQLKSISTAGKVVKVHMKDGSLFVLDSLITKESSDTINGFGFYYDKYRNMIGFNVTRKGLVNGLPFHIGLSDVALIELNEVEGVKGKALSLALVGVPTLIITSYCLINPKACFGSCPTFYSYDGTDTSLMAEGFSSSILRAFEKEDIDMLYLAKTTGNNFHLRMKNEALETQVIRYADLLVLPRSGNERVFSTSEGEFFKSSCIKSPETCQAPEGSCLDAVLQMDNKERFSSADPKNLAKKETIEMTFENVHGSANGLIIGCRQTLMTTWLFYQSLSYLGNSAGYFAAKVESGDKFLQRKVDRVWDLLGDIEIFMKDHKGKWQKISQVGEMGPIASDVHLIKLPYSDDKNIRIKLQMTKGLWRINYLALAGLEEKVEPITVKPSTVIAVKGANSHEADLLKNPDNPLITLPGDEYDIYYNLPESAENYEIFIKTRGYYIEWMRDTWIAEENLKQAAIFFGFPRLFMKKAAGDFKKIEPSMEESFWNSKYVRKN